MTTFLMPSDMTASERHDAALELGLQPTALDVFVVKAGFNENEPRDEHGQWTVDAGTLADKIREGGFTYNAITHEYPSKGFAVSITKEREQIYQGFPDRDQVASYMTLNEKSDTDIIPVKALREPNAHFGSWYEHDTGKSYLDVSIVLLDKEQAITLAREHEQLSIYDLEKGEVINVLKRSGKEAEIHVHPVSEDGHPTGNLGSVAKDPRSKYGFEADTKALTDTELSPLVRLASRLEPALRRRFLESLRQIQNTIELEQLIRAIEAGNLTRAEALMKFGEWPEAMGGLAVDMRAGFLAGTHIGNQKLAAVGLSMAFHNVDPYSVDWIQRRIPPLVESVVRGGKETVRDIVTDAMQGRYTPFTAAEQIKDWVGLTGIQSRALSHMRVELAAQGVSGSELKRRIAALKKAMIRQRAEVIARNEIMSAANNGQLQHWYEAERRGLLRTGTKKAWQVADDERLCPVCMDLGSAEPVGLHEQFTYKDGSLAFNVFDEALYAPTQHPQCRCDMYLIFPK